MIDLEGNADLKITIKNELPARNLKIAKQEAHAIDVKAGQLELPCFQICTEKYPCVFGYFFIVAQRISQID